MYFFKVLPTEKRKDLLPEIADFLQPDNPRNWRFKLTLAEQLIPLCELYPIGDIDRYLSSIAMTLATERIAEIRKAAHAVVIIVDKILKPQCWMTSPEKEAHPLRFISFFGRVIAELQGREEFFCRTQQVAEWKQFR